MDSKNQDSSDEFQVNLGSITHTRPFTRQILNFEQISDSPAKSEADSAYQSGSISLDSMLENQGELLCKTCDWLNQFRKQRIQGKARQDRVFSVDANSNLEKGENLLKSMEDAQDKLVCLALRVGSLDLQGAINEAQQLSKANQFDYIGWIGAYTDATTLLAELRMARTILAATKASSQSIKNLEEAIKQGEVYIEQTALVVRMIAEAGLGK